MNTSLINTSTKPGPLARVNFWRTAWLLVGLLCAPLPALAESIVWNGAGQPGTTGTLRQDPMRQAPSLFPDSPSGNSVTVNADVPYGNVAGGMCLIDSGNATAESSNNSVSINSGTIGEYVFGGFVNISSDNTTAIANDNSVSVSGGEIIGDIYGGYAENVSGDATATGNSVSVSDGHIKADVSGAFAWSEDGAAIVTGNSVSVSGGSINFSVDGGYAESVSGDATATGNSVSVSGGSINSSVDGGYAKSKDGAATVTGNSVSVSGGSIVGGVYGGYALSPSGTGTATATGNSVSISGGEIGDNVYGGYAYGVFGTSTTTATGNSVTLSGAPIFDSASDILGGDINTQGDSFTGNTLNIWNYSGSPVHDVMNFEHYDFVLPASLQGFRANNVEFEDSNGTSHATVTGVAMVGGGSLPQTGDVLTLISSNTLNGTVTNAGATISGQKGVTLLYDFLLQQESNSLTATVQGVQANPQAKAVTEEQSARSAFVNQAGDLAAGLGMDAAKNATGGSSTGLASFFAGQGAKARYNTGSHVDVLGFSLMAGLARSLNAGDNKLLLGAFFEAGIGNYDSHNSFAGYAPVDAKGDTAYYGGGALARFELPFSLYAEGSVRAGRVDSDFASGDLQDPLGNATEYETNAIYYGAHLGLGHVWELTQASSLDLYAKYFWTHQGSDSVNMNGDKLEFESSNSHRLRAGARFAYDLPRQGGAAFTPYVGAAYEYEFDGKAGATAYGYALDAAELTGGTGMGEVGLSLKPVSDSGLMLDLGLQGYLGQRQGVSGGLQLKWEF